MLSRPCHRPSASPPRAFLVSLPGPVMVGSSTAAKEPHIAVPGRTKWLTTATTTPNQPITYTLLVIFTVAPCTDGHLHDQQAIRDKAETWLASLDATVHGVNIRKAD